MQPRFCHSSVCTPLPSNCAKRMCNSRRGSPVRVAPVFDLTLSCARCTHVSPNSRLLFPKNLTPLFVPVFSCAHCTPDRFGSVMRVLHPCLTQLPTRLFLACVAPVFNPAPHGGLSYVPCTPPRPGSILCALHLCLTQLPMTLSCAFSTPPRLSFLLRALQPSSH